MTKLYTLQEARLELAKRECAEYGHNWDVLETIAGPVHVLCARCGKSYPVDNPKRKAA